MTAPLDLTAVKARVEAASPGPWEDGDVWGFAGVLPEMFGPGRCTYCKQSDPAWVGRMDINGEVMDAHRHRVSDPYGVGWFIATVDGTVADGFTRPEDQAFARHAREDIPALVAEVERYRETLEDLAKDCEAFPESHAWAAIMAATAVRLRLILAGERP